MKNETKEKLEYLKWKVQNQAIRVKNFAIEKGGMLVDWVVDNPAEAILRLGSTGTFVAKQLIMIVWKFLDEKRLDRKLEIFFVIFG